jgi:hypothetical protein
VVIRESYLATDSRLLTANCRLLSAGLLASLVILNGVATKKTGNASGAKSPNRSFAQASLANFLFEPFHY